MLPVIDYARKTQDSAGNDILIAVFTDISELVELQEKLEEQNQTILSSIRYASKIQRNLLPPASVLADAFSDACALWKPKDLVGGDIYWLKSFNAGTLLVLGDCTGHGTPGALLTMLLVSMLDSVVNERNCNDTAQIMLMLDQKISKALNAHTARQKESRHITEICDGCDLAILFVSRDKSVSISSAGIHVFICDGSQVRKIKGQRLFIGDGWLTDKKEVQIIEVAANPNNQYYIASDGFYDQIGGDLARPFGYRTFQELLMRYHVEKRSVIVEKMWKNFEGYRADYQRRDDVALIAFKP